MEGPDLVIPIGSAEGRDKDASPKAANPMAPRRQPTGGFAQRLQPPSYVVAMALWTENPAGEVGRANTNEQNSTDPHL